MFLNIFLIVERVGDAFWGIVIPALVLVISVYLTWKLYQRFSGGK